MTIQSSEKKQHAPQFCVLSSKRLTQKKPYVSPQLSLCLVNELDIAGSGQDALAEATGGYLTHS